MKTKGDRALKKQQRTPSTQATTVIGQAPPTVTVVHVHHQPGMPPSPPEITQPPGYKAEQV